MSSSLTPEFGEPGHDVPWRSLALVGLVLPLVAAAVLVWATTGRQDNLDRIPVAVVNNDKIIQQPQPMAAGRALAASGLRFIARTRQPSAIRRSATAPPTPPVAPITSASRAPCLVMTISPLFAPQMRPERPQQNCRKSWISYS